MGTEREDGLAKTPQIYASAFVLLHLPTRPIPRIMHLGILENTDSLPQRLWRSLIAGLFHDPLPERRSAHAAFVVLEVAPEATINVPRLRR